MATMSAPAVGDRLRCENCGTEIILVKAPTGPMSCCGRPMAKRAEEGVKGGQQSG